MKLIADSGSTKTEWCIINDQGHTTPLFTMGINPYYQSTGDIILSLEKEFLYSKESIHTIHFYGAGCANEEKNTIVRDALAHFFHCSNVNIASDLLGAARSLCQNQEGIACILGTGSNSCHYNGHQITRNVSPLGYVLGDEGSGAFMGKRLMADILKEQLSTETIQLFFDTYNTSVTEILTHVYKHPFPNRYLAQYTKFLSQNIHIPEIQHFVFECLNAFVERNLLSYPNHLNYYFTGSIAYHFASILHQVMSKHHLSISLITQAPMQGLIHYHTIFDKHHDQ
jgi:N-acetylglucosamine kinase-like BadF-type ATPase